jgi:hypothetical protein
VLPILLDLVGDIFAQIIEKQRAWARVESLELCAFIGINLNDHAK